MKYSFSLILFFFSFSFGFTQKKTSDSIQVKVGGKSRILITIGDPSDIPVIRRYDVEGLIDDLIERIEKRASGRPLSSSDQYLIDSIARRTQVEVMNAMKDLERELQRLEKDSLNGGLNHRQAEQIRRLAELQAQLAREQVRRQLKKIDTDREEDWVEEFEREMEETFGRDGKSDQDEEEQEFRDGPVVIRLNSGNTLGRIREKSRRTNNSFNIDFGTNNFLENGEFTDGLNQPYTVRPLGSWYVAGNSTYRTRIARHFFLEWGGGISFYNFKFLNDSIRIVKNQAETQFTIDQRQVDYRKSKLTAYYAQLFLVPVIDFGGNRYKPGFFDDHGSSSFRFGAGPYVGYRLDSYSKQSYKEEGERQTDRNHDNFYLNNLRYGVRVQVGFRDTDLFFNYDLNELFTAGKAPAVQAFSFGVSF